MPNNNQNNPDIRFNFSSRIADTFNRMNFQRRAPVVLIFDLSGSMRPSLPILRDSVRLLLNQLARVCPPNAELGIILFGDLPIVISELRPLASYTEEIQTAICEQAFKETLGCTYTAAALRSAMELVDSRRRIYQTGAYPGLLVSITDGSPVAPRGISDEEADLELKAVCEQIHQKSRNNEVRSVVLALSDDPLSRQQVEVLKGMSSDEESFFMFNKVRLTEVIRYATELVIRHTSTVGGTGGAL